MCVCVCERERERMYKKGLSAILESIFILKKVFCKNIICLTKFKKHFQIFGNNFQNYL